jgi:hypothetical protein
MNTIMLGGPANLQWFDVDSGARRIYVPLPTEATVFTDDPYRVMQDIRYGVYRVETLCSKKQQKTRQVLVWQGTLTEDAMRLLQNFLMEEFIGDNLSVL